MIDSHCHLDFKEFESYRQKAIDDAIAAGVHTMINIGVDLESSQKSVELAGQHDCIYGTVGVHPHDAEIFDEKCEEEIRQLLDSKKIVAVGEIGLDFYRDLSPRKVQTQVFVRQLEIAVEKNLPVVIHTRNSFRDALDVIKDYSARLPGGVFHCFPGTINEAYEVIELGFYVGLGGIITFPKAKMANVAEEISLENILIETDSPYLAPVPFRGKKNQPAFVKHVALKLAELKKTTLTEVEKVTDRSCRKLFRLVETFGG